MADYRTKTNFKMKFNASLIGYGYWGKNLLRNLKESAFVNDIVVADIDSNVLDKLTQKEKSIFTTNLPHETIQDPNIDVVVISTPSTLHYNLALEALENGKHVFVEKPLVTKSSEARELLKLSEQNNLTVAVDHTFLYNDAVKRVKTLVENGSFGQINYIDSTRINLGIYQQDVNVLWDLAAHDISMINYWTSELPDSVRAIGKVNKQHQIIDLAYLFLNYPSGVMAHVNCSWASPVKIRKTIIGGSQKMVIYDDVEPTDKLKIYNYENIEELNPDPKKVLIDYRLGDVTIPKLSLLEPLKEALNDFFESIVHGRNPLSDIQTGIDVIKILECANTSIKEGGKPIRLD